MLCNYVMYFCFAGVPSEFSNVHILLFLSSMYYGFSNHNTYKCNMDWVICNSNVLLITASEIMVSKFNFCVQFMMIIFFDSITIVRISFIGFSSFFDVGYITTTSSLVAVGRSKTFPRDIIVHSSSLF